jgi:peptidylprolyl isomerase domain and WD repeat-containing protein 1
MSHSHRGSFVATCCSTDKHIRIYDVSLLAMTCLLQLDYFPGAISWLYVDDYRSSPLLLTSPSDRTDLLLYDPFYAAAAPSYAEVTNGNLWTPIAAIDLKCHLFPMAQIQYNERHHFFVSIDAKGIIDYWQVDFTPLIKQQLEQEAPAAASSALRLKATFPKNTSPSPLHFLSKTTTDLFFYAKTKLAILSFEWHPAYSHFVILSSDWTIRVFQTSTGKVVAKVPLLEFEPSDASFKRMSDAAIGPSLPRVLFDPSGRYILFATGQGFHIMDWHTQKSLLCLGSGEDMHDFRGMDLCLFDISALAYARYKKARMTAEMVVSDNPAFKDMLPTYADARESYWLLATCYKKNRFAIFTGKEPRVLQSESADGAQHKEGSVAPVLFQRDIMNEKDNLRMNPKSAKTPEKPTFLMEDAVSVVIHSDYGDIHLTLYPRAAPLAVENFVTHAKNRYYDGTLFHRVIRKFMIQGGDPLGDGTGGESIWGKDFQDEILAPSDPLYDTLHFRKPYVVAMANTGQPLSNGSQFFMTLAPCQWLQGKHTIFGIVTKGFDTLKAIEQAKTDERFDKPLQDIRIIDIEFNK